MHRQDVSGRFVRRNVDSLCRNEGEVVEGSDSGSGCRHRQGQVSHAFEEEEGADADLDVERTANEDVHRHVGEPHRR